MVDESRTEQAEVLGNVADWKLVQVESSCSSRSGGASGSSGPVGMLRKKKADLDCARSSVDASSMKELFFAWKGSSHLLVESRASDEHCSAILGRSAFACGYHDIGYLRDLWLLAGLLCDWRLLDYLKKFEFYGIVCLIARSAVRLWTTQLFAYSTTSVLHDLMSI